MDTVTGSPTSIGGGIGDGDGDGDGDRDRDDGDRVAQEVRDSGIGQDDVAAAVKEVRASAFTPVGPVSSRADLLRVRIATSRIAMQAASLATAAVAVACSATGEAQTVVVATSTSATGGEDSAKRLSYTDDTKAVVAAAAATSSLEKTSTSLLPAPESGVSERAHTSTPTGKQLEYQWC